MSGVILNRSISARISRLMWMKYKPSEIAEELGISVETIYRSWLPAGIPFQKDGGRHIWIVGTELAEWVRIMKRRRRDRTHLALLREQAYCLKCRKPMVMQNPKARRLHQTTVHIKGTCPGCKGIIYRIELAAEWNNGHHGKDLTANPGKNTRAGDAKDAKDFKGNAK